MNTIFLKVEYMSKKIRLRTKLMILLLSVGLIPFLGISLFMYITNTNELTSSIFKSNLIFSEQTISQIERYFLEGKGQIQIVCNKSILINFLNLIATNDKNNSTFGTLERSLVEDLTFIKQIYDYSQIVVINKKEIVVADTSVGDKSILGKSVSKLSYIKNALAGTITYSKVYYSENIKDIVIGIAGPVRDKDTKEIIGALVILNNQTQLSSRIQKGIEVIGKTSDAYLIDDSGLLLTDMRLGKKEETLKVKVNSIAVNNIVNMLSKNNTKEVFQDIYINNRDEKVVGCASIIKIGENYGGLIIEVGHDEALSVVNRLTILMIFIAIIVGIIIAFIGFFVARSITKPIQNVIDTINESSLLVSTGSKQIADSSQRLSEGFSEQASSLEKTSSSINEIASMTEKNAENTLEANAMMEQTENVASRANISMKELTLAMNEITSTSEETAKIIKVIDEIAFQTNLLALNAAVEAARAGDAGSGFAIVADEVRNLAQRSAEAAKNTAELIESSIKSIKEGFGLTQTTEKDFGEVFKILSKVKILIEEIAVASKEQTRGLKEINSSITIMDKAIQGNAASSEEGASACEEMSSQAQTLTHIINDLISIVGHNNTKIT